MVLEPVLGGSAPVRVHGQNERSGVTIAGMVQLANSASPKRFYSTSSKLPLLISCNLFLID